MNRIEQLEFELKCRKMVEGTDLVWLDVVKFDGKLFSGAPTFFGVESGRYECALGILEGKPVFKGDEIYHRHDKVRVVEAANTQFGIADQHRLSWIYIEDCSWGSPKPKTVMVELSVEDAEQIAYWHGIQYEQRLKEACREALEKLQCD